MQKQQKLKYVSYAVVCEEVPDEISLAINISGCPYKCKGCHSQYLWEYTGNYISDDLDKLIDKYNSLITCVCFMGGDQNLNELYDLCKRVKKRGYKVCIYSGGRSTKVFSVFYDTACLDYIKIGNYIESCGGLNNRNTNQRMYEVIYDDNNTKLFFADITYRFYLHDYEIDRIVEEMASLPHKNIEHISKESYEKSISCC